MDTTAHRSATIWILLLCLIALLGTAGCGDAGDGGQHLTAEILTLAAAADCDGGSNPGDFFVDTEMLEELLGGTREIVDASGETLVQINDGESVDVPDTFATGVFPSDEFSAVDVGVGFYENDPSGPQVSTRRFYSFDFRTDLGCWIRSGDPSCLEPDGTGALFRDTLSLRDGAACEAELTWALFLD